MSKKSNQKKKVGLKLSSGQTFMVEDLEAFLHIQKTYADIMRGQLNEQEKTICSRIIAATNVAIEHTYTAPSDDYNED